MSSVQVALQYCAIVVDKAAAHETFHSDFGTRPTDDLLQPINTIIKIPPTPTPTQSTYFSFAGYLTVLNPIVRECSAAMMQVITCSIRSMFLPLTRLAVHRCNCVVCCGSCSSRRRRCAASRAQRFRDSNPNRLDVPSKVLSKLHYLPRYTPHPYTLQSLVCRLRRTR